MNDMVYAEFDRALRQARSDEKTVRVALNGLINNIIYRKLGVLLNRSMTLETLKVLEPKLYETLKIHEAREALILMNLLEYGIGGILQGGPVIYRGLMYDRRFNFLKERSIKGVEIRTESESYPRLDAVKVLSKALSRLDELKPWENPVFAVFLPDLKDRSALRFLCLDTIKRKKQLSSLLDIDL